MREKFSRERTREQTLLVCVLAIAAIDTSAQKAGALTIFYNGKIFPS